MDSINGIFQSSYVILKPYIGHKLCLGQTPPDCGVARKLRLGKIVFDQVLLQWWGIKYVRAGGGELRVMPESRAKRNWVGRGLGRGFRWAPLQKSFEKSYLKPFSLLVYSWSGNLSFSQWRIQEFAKDWLGPDFDPSQIQVSLGAMLTSQLDLEWSPSYQWFWCISKECLISAWHKSPFSEKRVRDGPNKHQLRAVARIWRGVHLYGRPSFDFCLSPVKRGLEAVVVH